MTTRDLTADDLGGEKRVADEGPAPGSADDSFVG